MKIGFYVLGKKGYFSLQAFKNTFGADSIAFVIGAHDEGIENDWHSEITDFCASENIVFRTRSKANIELLPHSDYKFAIGWRWIINDADKLIVCHDSLLPKYRGFAPLVNMLIEGEPEIGVTALLASAEYDKGDVIYQAKKDISYPKKISDAIDEILPLYVELVIKTANDIYHMGRLNVFPQNESLASYSLWRDERDYIIDWNSDAKRISRFVDAVGSPYRGATAFICGEIVRIFAVEPIDDVVIENRTSSIGKIIFITNNHPVVVCGVGLLKIVDIRSFDGSSLIGKITFRSRLESKK